VDGWCSTLIEIRLGYDDRRVDELSLDWAFGQATK
jgi:hypothetical protein